MGSSTAAGWVRVENSGTAGQEALGIRTGGDIVPYLFGLGAANEGRIATSNLNGGAITVPDDYGFGEMIELRYTFAETGNSQRQGIFMDVRTSAANSSTVRGMEVMAQQEGAVAVGTLSGGTFKAITRSSTTGTITGMYGLEAETTHNSDAYTGTVTTLATIRAKCSLEDGATYTYGSVFRGELEGITGAKAIDAGISLHASGGATVNYLIDTSGVESTNYNANRVVLWKFKGANGTNYFVVHDVDSATSLVVDTDEVE